MTQQEILEHVRAVIAAEIGEAKARGVDRDTDLVGDLGLDSLGLLTLTVALENRFARCLDEPDDPLTRVGAVVDWIASALVTPDPEPDAERPDAA